MTSTLAQGPTVAPGRPRRSLRALAATPALILLLLAGLSCGSLSHTSSSRPPASRPTSHVRVVGADAGRARPGGFYANAGLLRLPAGVPLRAVAASASLARATAARRRPRPRRSSSCRRCSWTSRSGYVLYRLVLGWTWPGRRAERLALLAAALYVFNPVTLYDSALWGQTRRRRRARAAARRGRADPRQQRGRGGAGGRSPPWSSRSSASCSSRSWPFCCVKRHLLAAGLRAAPPALGTAVAARLAGARAGRPCGW